MESVLKLDPELQAMLDATPPYELSIEPVGRPAYRYGYHLGHNLEAAKAFVRIMFHDYDAQHGSGVYTMAIFYSGGIVDVYDGRDWSSDLSDKLYSESIADEITNELSQPHMGSE